MSEQTTIKGTIYKIGETETITEKFKKRELVLKTDGEYPQHVPIQFVQAKCDMLDKYSVGNTIEVNYNLRGRLYTDKAGVEKCFGSVEGWKISTIEGGVAPSHLDTINEMPF